MKKRLKLTLILILLISQFPRISVSAEDKYVEEANKRKEMPIESNQYSNWPIGPKLGAQSAYLLDMNSGVVLYEKNIYEKLYPASVTKMLTALVVLDNCKLEDEVTFSEAAVGSINWREDANIGISAGNIISVEECLYGLLVGSANEVAYALAEHVSGSGNLEGFAELMNAYADSLGCKNSHFVTPNGIHNDNHYTCAYDLGLIATRFFSNELLCKISSTTTYHIPKSPTQPREDMIMYAKCKLLPGREYAYDKLIGTKTGYTDLARQTLVSCAEYNDMKLVCVILKEEAPYQFTDTIDLFNFGFTNFETVNVADVDTTYSMPAYNSINTSQEVFGSNKPLVQIEAEDYLIVPAGVTMEDLTSKISFDNLTDEELARADYYYNETYVGKASIIAPKDKATTFNSEGAAADMNTDMQDKVIIINLTSVIMTIAIILIVLTVVIAIISRLRQNKRKGRLHFKF